VEDLNCQKQSCGKNVNIFSSLTELFFLGRQQFEQQKLKVILKENF